MQIIYEDNRIVVCIKPAGIISTDVPGGAPEILRKQLQTACIRTVHRLDARVSGLMVFAKSVRAASILSEQIRSQIFHKSYLAIVHGRPPASGIFIDQMYYDKNKRKAFVTDGASIAAQRAELTYQVLKENEKLSLVKINLITGRTHQIRLQFSSRGYPLYGDKKYGIDDAAQNIALWSYHISFIHPESNKPMEFTEFPSSSEWQQF